MLNFSASLFRFLRFAFGFLVRTKTRFLLSVEIALATQRGRSRVQHLSRRFARVYHRHTGCLITVAVSVQTPLELQIALFFVRVAGVVTNVVKVAALGHLGQRQILLIYLQKYFATIYYVVRR